MKKLLLRFLTLLIVVCMVFPIAAFANYVGDVACYPGTGVPTYTSVTGRQFKSRMIKSEGYLYTYDFNDTEFYPYLDTLVRYGYTYTYKLGDADIVYTISKGMYSFEVDFSGTDSELSFVFHNDIYSSGLPVQTGLYYEGTMVPTYTGTALTMDFYAQQLGYSFEYMSNSDELLNYLYKLNAYGYGLLSIEPQYDSDGIYTQYIYVNPNTSEASPIPVFINAYSDGRVSINILK